MPSACAQNLKENEIFAFLRNFLKPAFTQGGATPSIKNLMPNLTEKHVYMFVESSG